jgi:hypothetical protein
METSRHDGAWRRRRFCERCSRVTDHTGTGIELVEAPATAHGDADRLLVPYRVLKCERCWTETMRLLGS